MCKWCEKCANDSKKCVNDARNVQMCLFFPRMEKSTRLNFKKWSTRWWRKVRHNNADSDVTSADVCCYRLQRWEGVHRFRVGSLPKHGRAHWCKYVTWSWIYAWQPFRLWRHTRRSISRLPFQGIQIKPSLYSRYYAEACNEWRSPSSRFSAWQHSSDETSQWWWQCADLTSLGIERRLPAPSWNGSLKLELTVTQCNCEAKLSLVSCFHSLLSLTQLLDELLMRPTLYHGRFRCVDPVHLFTLFQPICLSTGNHLCEENFCSKDSPQPLGWWLVTSWRGFESHSQSDFSD